jgi:hypothetical protein
LSTKKSTCDPKSCNSINVSCNMTSIQRDSSIQCNKVCDKPCE